MKPNLVNSVITFKQAGISMSVVVMEEEPCYELISNMKIELITESDEMGEEPYEVEDPIQETAVVIEITINQYNQSLDVPELLTLVNTANPYLYFLEGFLDEDGYHRLDQLNSLVRHKTVNAQSLEIIKRFVLSNSSRIKQVALELRPADLCIEVEFDLVRQYGTHEDLGEHDANDMFGMEFDDNDDEDMFDRDYDNDVIVEDMFDRDYDNDVRKPALQSLVEALETRKFENKEDLELMMKSSWGCSSSCMVCLDEFSIDAADGGIWIKTMPCTHMFHKECIDKWLEKRYTCPICRYAMPTAD